MNERNMKWKRLATERMSRILLKLESISNLSSHNYEYKDEWVLILIKYIQNTGNEVRSHFKTNDKLNINTNFKFSNFIKIDDTSLTAKEKKFLDLSEKRMTSLLKELLFFSNLSNKKNYNYDLMDLFYLFDEIYDKKVAEIEMWFMPLKRDIIQNQIDISILPTEK